MAESEEWFFGEVGSLNIGEPAVRVTYHSSLNALLVATKDPKLRVIDVTSGGILKTSDLSASQTTDGIQCIYLASQDKLLFSNGYAVCVRKDLNGVMLLDTALQTPVKNTNDIVKVELPLPDASQLFKSLMAAELAGVDHVEDVLHELETEIDAAQHASKHNHKVAKWATVCLKLPYFALKTVCSSLVTELKRSHQNTLGLSVASAISDRLLYLMPNSHEGGPNAVDRSLMYSEAARRETFAKWPHMNYKWALPDPMAKAGFYHQPNSTGDDRAMCFTCNVCLVCWEPTDEPWSEHERHSSSCPFVKGEHTQNVPLSVTYATEPAKPHGEKNSRIACISTMSNCDMFATSTLHGSVVLWDFSRVLKRYIQFHIDPLEHMFPYQTGSTSKSNEHTYCSLQESSSSQSSQESVMEVQAWNLQTEKSYDHSDQGTAAENSETTNMQTESVEPSTYSEACPKHMPSSAADSCQQVSDCQVSENCTDTLKEMHTVSAMLTESNAITEPIPDGIAEEDILQDSTDEHGHAEVIEVKGAWLKYDHIEPLTDVPLNDDTGPGFTERRRPSRDVVVTALSVVGPYTTQATSTSDIPVHPSLISGVLICTNNQSVPSAPSSTSNASLSEKSEVQTLNQVNQAISEETTPAIIPEIDNLPVGPVTEESFPVSRGTFQAYLLVHYIGQGRKCDSRNCTKDGMSKSCAVEVKDKPSVPEVVFVEGIIKDYTPLSACDSSASSSTGLKENQESSCSVMSSSWSRSVRNAQPDGAIIQCIPLIVEVGPSQYIQSITPTSDGRHIIVVTAPKVLDGKLSALHGSPLECAKHGGSMLIYRLKQDSDCMMLEESPCRMSIIDNVNDAIVSLSLLPVELGGGEGVSENGLHSTDTVQGSMVVTTHGGEAKIVILDSMKTVGTIAPPEGEQFISATFCTGIDRLCCCSKDGELYFYVVGPCGLHMEDLALGLEPTGSLSKLTCQSATEDVPDSGSLAADTAHKTESLLVNQPLTPEVLQNLYSLTQFENLVPRFCATVPPCWNEIQQEQQQRHHPQHLQQQGDSTQHTRTWKLYPDSTSWDEHLFELVIPKSCCVGHVDVKFSLFSLCTNVPNIQVTLLRQSMSKLGRAHGVDLNETIPEESELPAKDVDDKIEFNLKEMWTNPTDEDKVDQSDESAAASCSQLDDRGGPCVSEVINPVTTQAFLDRHGAEILCGPVDLHQCVDMSGLGGVITLTGPELLKIKSRSFLLHIKAMINPNQEKSKSDSGDKTKQDHKDKPSRANVSKSIKRKDVSLCVKDRLNALSSKQKPEPLKGCDWLQEISITVRRCKPVNIPRERLERVTMLENQVLHSRLLKLVCGVESASDDGNSTWSEQQCVMALEILTWICSILMYATDRSAEQAAIVLTAETFLPSLIQTCYINANRSVARQCTKFFTVLNEFGRSPDDQNLSVDFSSSLLTALLDALPLIPSAHSAGALRWFFVLLNRVKCMDTTLTGTKCVEMLSTVASVYNERNNPLHALLKSRFGLYGHPLEPELFDIDPPGLAKTSASAVSGFVTYAGALANNNNNNGSPSAASTTQQVDETDIRDYLLLASGEKAASGNGKCMPDQLSEHVFGLLEVEPLHFTCHAASDGTRVERIEQGTGHSAGTTSGVSGLSGTINFGPDTAASGNPLTSLSAATEHQLSLLNQKHLQLLKLQQQKQKLEQTLAETSNKGASSVYNNPELFPPTPKNTPFFMTPPVTPPNESYHNIYIGGIGPADPGKPPTNKDKSGEPKPHQLKSSFFWSQTQHLFQPMPPQALVIERLHSGARRFVVLDFGKPVLLTDVVIPGCSDLQSLSIDIWTLGEDVDGQRLVVANDIGMRSLILNDLSPPPLCRYLKITTIGRHGGSVARSRIPLGSFYGHTFLSPLQTNVTCHPLAPSCDQQPGPSTGSSQSEEQTHLMSQLGLCMSLHEDIQCRYSLACNRLTSLLSTVQVPLNSVEHTLYYLKQGKKVEDDKRISQAYYDCMSLQLQLNLAECAIDRLQGMLGIRPRPQTGLGLSDILQQAGTDKLRVLSELLLDTLLGMTYPRPTIPQVPAVLYTMFTPQTCENLFRNLCVAGTKKMQINAGVLLVRLCSCQPWWGGFLSGTLQQYFSSEQPLIFPRDRVFLVLSALSQKSLPGNSGNQLLESLVTLLGQLLSPLLSQNSDTGYRTVPAVVDQNLVSWVLLFLSRSLDCASPGWLSEEITDKSVPSGSSRDKESYGSNRWDFLQGESSLQKRSGATRSRRSYHNRQRGLFWHSKHQLHVQQKKKEYLTEQASKVLSTVYASSKPEAYKLDALNKTHAIIKKQYKQYSSKHFKDLLNIRRTAGEYLRKRDKDDPSQTGDPEGEDTDLEVQFMLSREKCLLAVKGLVALLLSMDFTCHVDLFIVGCKVLARITSITRPILLLSEVMSQSELDDLILLTCGAEYNHGNTNWGSSWAGHTIACLLQDILDGERMYGLSGERMTEDDISASVVTETDTSLQNSTTLPTIDEDNNTTATTAPEASSQAGELPASAESKSSPDELAQDIGQLSMLLQEDDAEIEAAGAKYQEQGVVPKLELNKSDQHIIVHVGIDSKSSGGLLGDPKIQIFKMNKGKAGQQYNNVKAVPVPQGISTAMDARLELGVQLATELKLKVMLSVDIESVQSALTAPVPPLMVGSTHSASQSQSHQPTDDEQLSEVSTFSFSQQQVTPSLDMLSACFNSLFCHHINIDMLLLLWLTLNEDSSQEESGAFIFDSSHVPSIPLSETAVSSLLEAIARAPYIPVRTWVLAFQCLTLLANLKYTPQSSEASAAPNEEKWLAQAMLADPNLMNVFLKFLSWTNNQGMVISTQQHTQVGPTAVRAFHDVLVRLQLRCAEENEFLFRELLLKLVYQLSTDWGAFSVGIGPLDAQCSLLDHMLELSYEKQVDVNNAISIIECVSQLVYQHIMSQEHVGCRSSTEGSLNARSCFGGMFASMLRASNSRSITGDANRDVLMSNLLSLVNLLVQAPGPTRAPRRSTIASVGSISEVFERSERPSTDSPMTDISKISHSLGGASAANSCLANGIMTSTPNVPLSDEEKGGETDEQKTEHAMPMPKAPNLTGGEPRKSCSHFWDSMNPDGESKDVLIADFILQHQHIMFHLMQALSYCTSDPVATIIGSNGMVNKTFLNLDPLSVGDGIFQILCTLNSRATELPLILKPLYQYLSSNVPSGRCREICQLSEPLLWFALGVLDCESAIKTFMDMGGIQVICENLVRSTHSVINTSPGLVSTIMQYLGLAKGKNSLPKKVYPVELDNNETLQNFAPIGTITSSSPSAGPADVLIEGVAPHRRARSAAWSFNFYPHEAWVDLIITLPCAVLLKEVHIQPHLASLSTCPSAVTLEISRDGLTQIPVTSPLVTSGLNSIKIVLQKAEVVTMVTIRLHKPRDSTTIGLSQIKLLGSSAFGEMNKNNGMGSVKDEYIAKTSMSWLRLLHHCLTRCKSIQDKVAIAATPVQPLLKTCTSLLLSPGANLYINHIESVLLTLGLHSADMGLGLIDHLLRNAQPSEDQGRLGRGLAIANESTVDLLYRLGTHQDQATPLRVQAMIDWLGDSARTALQKAHVGSTEGRHHYGFAVDLSTAAPAHVHCVAAILWNSQEKHVGYNLFDLVSLDLLSAMYEWAMVLSSTSTQKQAVDAVICSICYIHPEYFATLLEWMGIVISVDFTHACVTDDHKDSRAHQRQEAMTDDLKATTEAHHMSAGIGQGLQPVLLQDFGHMMLDESHLSTLALACQSPISLRQLVGSNFLAVLCQGLYEFCIQEMARYGEPVITSEMFTDRGQSGSRPVSPKSSSSAQASSSSSQTKHSSDSVPQEKRVTITADLVAPVLHFLAETSREVIVKDWLGNEEGCVFWPVLLRLLCAAPVTITRSDSAQNSKYRALQQSSAIESAAIDFFSCVLSCHHGNQVQFANILCDVIRSHGSTIDEYGYRTSPLCGFMRCLFLQVLLEDEKVSVCLNASSHLYKGHCNAVTGLIQHPRFGAGHRFRVLRVSLQSVCSEIVAKVSDTPSLASQTAQLLEEKGQKAEDWLLEGQELGIDTMVEQMTAAAGMHAKEKREKPGMKSASPSRPPSRRGNRPSDTLSNINIPVLLLYHNLLPGQELPGDLTVSQLLVLLKERGLPEGQSDIHLFLKFKVRSANGAVISDPKADSDGPDISELGQDVEPIPESVLLDTPSLPSALQVFASVGGLALLAEHLPLLYPEVTRQGSPVDGRREVAGGGVGQDWLPGDNADDIYEEIFEPIPSNQSIAAAKQTMCSTLSIPPHSLVAFGLFLRLPGYAEVLLREKRKAQCLLRLVLGVTDDGEGGHILTSPVASSLPTLPFNVLKLLFDATPLSTDDGVLLRRMALEIGAVHLVLACLSVLSHHAPIRNIPGIHHEIILAASQAACAVGTSAPSVSAPKPSTDEKSQQYWAKGTGFGTGSTASYWDAEQALIRQRCEEEHVTCLLHVLASFINPGAAVNLEHLDNESDPVPLPPSLYELLSQSCLVPALCSYLRNDSVLDMARHVPLYRALLELLRGIAVCPMLVPLLLPQGNDEDSNVSVSSLLDKMKVCVDTYASRLKTNKKSKMQREDDDSGGLALLIPDIQATAKVVDTTIHRIKEKTVSEAERSEDSPGSGQHGASTSDCSFEERYMNILRELQFDTYEIVVEEDGKLEFTVPHHYESNVKAAGEVNNAARARRLAQEAVTLSTSLPLSASSSVFVRCDEERLDVLKVLITGPADTPYANGCFEFDVYFPQDYPNTPPQINLETTGNHTVRFNPNLYNDGKVCLSILNTWHGRPEEKWNSQTSSFLQVLVSIQSLILVSEPYFNEPGYERSRGTASGTWCCKEYDANIRQATVKWAMLEMLKNPPACFKEVIECHFWLKRHEIIRQIEDWIADLEANMNDKRVRRAIRHSCVALKHHFSQLKDEFSKMKPPECIPNAASEQLPENCQTNAEQPSTSSRLPQDSVRVEEIQADADTAASGQAMSSFNFVDVVELADEEFSGFISDTDSDVMDLTTPGPSEMLNSLDNAPQPHVNMNSISPSSPSGSDGQQNAASNEVQKSVHSNLYYL